MGRRQRRREKLYSQNLTVVSSTSLEVKMTGTEARSLDMSPEVSTSREDGEGKSALVIGCRGLWDERDGAGDRTFVWKEGRKPGVSESENFPHIRLHPENELGEANALPCVDSGILYCKE